MSDLHPDHVTPVLALEDQDACSPLVLRSAGLQAAKIIRKLTNDLGYREQEITRLRADLAAAQEREQRMREATICAAVEEYLLRHLSEGPDERLSRAATVRGMMVRLGLYCEFEQAIDRAVFPSPTHGDAGSLCSDCPQRGYPMDKTRCEDCPRAALSAMRGEP